MTETPRELCEPWKSFNSCQHRPGKNNNYEFKKKRSEGTDSEGETVDGNLRALNKDITNKTICNHY